MEATDATRNEADFPIVDYGATNGLVYYDAQGTSLSPSEVWRLRMQFMREKDFPPDRIWTTPDLPVHAGNLLPANLVTNLHGYQVTLASAPRNRIRAKLTPKPEDGRMRLVGIMDNRGAKVEHSGGSFEDDQFDGEWSISREAESIRITIAISETRRLEFLARPARQ
jgi:hypothetical protein